MLPVETTYPQFEANQVLSNKHLNDLFEYLDEQNRLTRTNLIGIGIVCGLEVQTASNGSSITITKGCGVTSQGYLVAMAEFVATHYVDYKVPEALPYPLFYDATNNQNKYPMWELKPNATGGATALTSAFLQDKIVLIFVELLEEKLKNCSPNSCDDKGTTITATFRPLLLTKADADKVIAEVNAIVGPQTGTDIDQIINAKYYLPEIRLPRFDVPATALVTTDQIANAYRNLLTKSFIETTLRTALTDAFDAFDLLLEGLDKNIIQNWQATYGADNKVDLSRPYKYQYFYDFILDVLETYREIRQKGLEVIGLCCPDERLFPRHLFLREAAYNAAHQRKYRHYFIPSPILTNQRALGEELRQLFERLLTLIQQFLIPIPSTSGITKQNPYDNNIRITPSKLGDVYLSNKAIPYYYQVNTGTPPLYELWNFERTHANKAKQNLSYHANLYATDDFALNPLKYDLEPYNFLRIEGHVGKDYLLAVRTIVRLQQLNRLPFDIVAVKTGNQTDDIQDIRQHECYFQDLEAIYLTFREEFECYTCKQIRYFYDLPSGTAAAPGSQPIPTAIATLRSCDPNFSYFPGTFGADYEKLHPQIESGQIPNIIGANTGNTLAALFLYNLIKVKENLPASLSTFVTSNYDAFIDFYQKLETAGKALKTIYNQLLNNPDGPNTQLYIRIEDIIDHIDAILEVCKRDAFEALQKEYQRRLNNLHQQLLFSNYVKKHPGIQHKAGVPMGGTFILVYHGDFTRVNIIDNIRDVFVNATLQEVFANVNISNEIRNTLTTNFTKSINKNFTDKIVNSPTGNITNNPALNFSGDIIFNPPGGGRFPNFPGSFTPRGPEEEPEIVEGTVVADFYLPYLCCSDCPPVQYILPTPPVEVDPLEVAQGEPDCVQNNQAFVKTFTISGGTPPYQVNGNIISGNSFTQTFASGQGGSMEVSDSADQKVTVTVEAHTCEQPCNKPCGGEALRCHYHLFMSKPETNNRVLYDFTEVATLVIKNENGQEIFNDNLKPIIDEVFSANNRSISNANFDNKITSLIKRINDLVATKLGDADSFKLGYDPAQGSLITIEYYACYTFTLRMMIGYSQNDNAKVQVDVTYNQEKVSFSIRVNGQNNQKFEIPKFGCTQLNKCNNTVKEDCRIQVIKNIDVTGNLEKFSLTASLSPSPGAGAKFFWLLEWSNPAFGTAQNIDGTFITPGFVKARLLVIDAKGCWQYFEKAIQIRG